MCLFVNVCCHWASICFRDCFSQLSTHCDWVRRKTTPLTREEVLAEKACCLDKDTCTCNNRCVGKTCMYCHRCWCDCFLFNCNDGRMLVSTGSESESEEDVMDKDDKKGLVQKDKDVLYTDGDGWE